MSVGRVLQRSRTPCPAHLRLALLALPLFLGTACVDGSVSPDEVRIAHLSLAASFPSLASQQPRAIDAWRVEVHRPGKGSAAEAGGTVDPDQATVTVDVTVTLETACENFLIRIELLSGGEVWYRAEREHRLCAGRRNQVPIVQLEWVGPSIGITPAQLSFSADQGTNPSPQIFTVTNAGGGALSWCALEDAAWLTVAPAAGFLGPGASQSVTAAVTSDNLDPGQFQTNIVVSDPNAANSPRILPVSLTVTEVATSVLRGTVSVEGTGIGGVTVTLSGTESRTDSTGSSGHYQFTGLRAGTYTVAIRDLPPGVIFQTTSRSVSVGVGESVEIDFAGDLVQPPYLEISTTSLSFFAVEGMNPDAQSFTVTNGGGGTLNWTASADAEWLTLEPWSGSLGKGQGQWVTARVDAAALNAGDYSATITFTDPAADNSPQTISVSLTLVTPAPTISNLTWALLQLNDTTCWNLGTRFELYFDYSDPDGDVLIAGDSLAGKPIQLDWWFRPDGFSGSGLATAAVDGTGFSGSATFQACVAYQPAQNTSVDLTCTLTDGAGHQSNSLFTNIPRPSGANSPPSGSAPERGIGMGLSPGSGKVGTLEPLRVPAFPPVG